MLNLRFGSAAIAYMLASSVLLVGLPAACSAEVAPIVWKLDDTSRVSGHAATVAGSPRVMTEGGESAVCFNGASDALFLSVNPIAGWREFTIEASIKPDTNGPEEQRFLHIQDERESRLLLETRLANNGKWALDTFLLASPEVRLTLLDREQLHPPERWQWVALTFDGETMAHYVNGKKELEGKIAFTPMTNGRMSLGVRLNKVSWYKGCIREIRFTPRALREAALQQEQE
jgi:hypothetical protein